MLKSSLIDKREKEMKYVIYNKETTEALVIYTGGVGCSRTSWDTERSAKIRLKNYIKKYGEKRNVTAEDFGIVDVDTFRSVIRPPKMVEKRCFMTGEIYMEERDTPDFLSRHSETYWSS